MEQELTLSSLPLALKKPKTQIARMQKRVWRSLMRLQVKNDKVVGPLMTAIYLGIERPVPYLHRRQTCDSDYSYAIAKYSVQGASPGLAPKGIHPKASPGNPRFLLLLLDAAYFDLPDGELRLRVRQLGYTKVGLVQISSD